MSLPSAMSASGLWEPLLLPGPSGHAFLQFSKVGRPAVSQGPEVAAVSDKAMSPWQPQRASSSSQASSHAADTAVGLASMAVLATGLGMRRQPALRRSRRQRRLRLHSRRVCVATAASAGGAEVEEEEDSDEDELPWERRQATPRERQFYGAGGGQRRPTGRDVDLPLCRLHAAITQKHLPTMMEAAGLKTSAAGEVIGAWTELLEACQTQAPELLETWNAGVMPLLRIAVAVPRDKWVRSPAEPWALPRQAPEPPPPPAPKADKEEDERFYAEPEPPTMREGPDVGAASLPQLEALVKHVLCKYELPAVLARGLVWSYGGGGVMRECPGREVIVNSASCEQQSIRFTRLLAAVGAGEVKPIVAAKEMLTPGLTKKMVGTLLASDESAKFPGLSPVVIPEDVRFIQPETVIQASPLAALRIAQVVALGGTEALASAIVGTRLGKDIGIPEEEEYAETVMSWLIRFADAPELADLKVQRQAVEWLIEQHDLDPNFAINVAGNPRAPKKVVSAAERSAGSLMLQRLQTSGQRFQRNPATIKGFVKRGVICPVGNPNQAPQLPEWAKKMGLPIDFDSTEVPNSWQGDEYETCEIENEFMTNQDNFRRCTVRIDEIMSFEYLQHVGDNMKNCLRIEKRGGSSLVKYLRRVQSRDSSFWAMTITPEIDEDEEASAGKVEEVQYMLMLEVYNGMKVIHQAEGPHPRRWPRPDAWQWLKEWGEREGLSPDGPEGVTVGPWGGYTGRLDGWALQRCFLW